MDVDLDLVKLRTLVEIRATGSMTAAALALGYTTGAVSQQMAALQRSVRAELFTQVGRRVQLTDAGHLLADHAVGLLSLARQTEQALANLSGRPQARVLVGVFGTAAAALLPRALVRVRSAVAARASDSARCSAYSCSGVRTGRPIASDSHRASRGAPPSAASISPRPLRLEAKMPAADRGRKSS